MLHIQLLYQLSYRAASEIAPARNRTCDTLVTYSVYASRVRARELKDCKS